MFTTTFTQCLTLYSKHTYKIINKLCKNNREKTPKNYVKVSQILLTKRIARRNVRALQLV